MAVMIKSNEKKQLVTEISDYCKYFNKTIAQEHCVHTQLW